jgi:hypothetical protein
MAFPLDSTRYSRKLWPAALSIVLCLAPAAVPGQAGQIKDEFEEVRKADLDLARIGWRLITANAPLCDKLEPGIGLQLHTLDQFDAGDRDAAQSHFGFATQVAIEGVIPQSPAEKAGLRADDSLVRVGTIDIAALPGRPHTIDRLVAAQNAIASLPPTLPIEVDALRGGVPVHVTVQPIAACKSWFELLLVKDFKISGNESRVRISARFFSEYPEGQVAAIIAHELAHNVLRHPDRLAAQRVNYGMLSGFGRNVKYFRQTELEADILSIYLLINAGYDPAAAPAFWRSFGPDKVGSIFRSRSHPHWRDRVATLESEIAKLEKLSARPAIPSWLGERDQPLTGNWQALIVRH